MSFTMFVKTDIKIKLNRRKRLINWIYKIFGKEERYKSTRCLTKMLDELRKSSLSLGLSMTEIEREGNIIKSAKLISADLIRK